MGSRTKEFIYVYKVSADRMDSFVYEENRFGVHIQSHTLWMHASLDVYMRVCKCVQNIKGATVDSDHWKSLWSWTELDEINWFVYRSKFKLYSYTVVLTNSNEKV